MGLIKVFIGIVLFLAIVSIGWVNMPTVAAAGFVFIVIVYWDMRGNAQEPA